MNGQQPERAKKFVLSHMGGVNTGADLTDVEDNQFTQLSNWYPYAGRLKRRGGTTKITKAGHSFTEEITSAFAFKERLGSWTLIVGGVTNFGKMVDHEMEQIPMIPDPYPSSDKPWSMAQYKNILYMARENCRQLQRTDGLVVDNAGIARPDAAPTLAQGAAGNLVAGDYIGVVTFCNSSTGAESDPSDASNTLTLGADKKIDWTGIDTSSSAQVDARRLYRTLHSQEGEYYFVGQINDNIATTYEDNVIQAELGVMASFDNGEPPLDPVLIAVFGERLWLTDGVDLFFSSIGLPESFHALDYLSITPDDGHKITGLLPFGDRLLVGKSNGVHYLDSPDAVATLTDKHGVISPMSFKTAEGYAFWFGGDNFYQTDGTVVRTIGDVEIRGYIDDIWEGNEHKIQSVIDTKSTSYITLIPSGFSDLNLAVVFNYKDETWSTFKWTTKTGNYLAPGFITEFYDTNGAQIIYGNLREELSDIFEFLDPDATTDDGKAIRCFCYTKYFGADNEQNLKYMRRAAVHANPQASYLQFTLLGDDQETLSGPVNVYMYGGRRWKRFPLSNNGKLAASMCMVISYEDVPNMEISGLAFDLVDTGREVPISETS
jgi:hypothetical protein